MLASRFASQSPPLFHLGDIEIKVATEKWEIQASQLLRYEVFYEELGAIPAHFQISQEKRDFDKYDAFCDHLIAIDHAKNRRIIGSYRLLSRKAALAVGGFFSESEYDLSVLYRFSGEILELGRACVHPEYRKAGLIQSLWRAIYAYMYQHKIDLMFGCGSFPTIKVEEIQHALSYLNQHYLAPESIRPRALEKGLLPLQQVPVDQVDFSLAYRQMPPLIKGYMRMGGSIGEGAFLDTEFGSIDVCIIFESSKIPQRYFEAYQKEKA
jgi:L-ornithine Nalpha-acyltransferase